MMRLLAAELIKNKKGRKYTEYCEVCNQATREQKPACQNHVHVLPHAQFVLKQIEYREKELKKIKKYGINAISQKSTVIRDIFSIYDFLGPMTVERISREVNIDKTQALTYCRFIVKYGLGEWVECADKRIKQRLSLIENKFKRNLTEEDVCKKLSIPLSRLQYLTRKNLPYDIFYDYEKDRNYKAFNLEEVQNWNITPERTAKNDYFRRHRKKKLKQREIISVMTLGIKGVAWGSDLIKEVVQTREPFTLDEFVKNFNVPKQAAQIYCDFLIEKGYANFEEPQYHIISTQPFRNKTAPQLGEIIGLHPTTISRWTTNEGLPCDEYPRKERGNSTLRIYSVEEAKTWIENRESTRLNQKKKRKNKVKTNKAKKRKLKTEELRRNEEFQAIQDYGIKAIAWKSKTVKEILSKKHKYLTVSKLSEDYQINEKVAKKYLEFFVKRGYANQEGTEKIKFFQYTPYRTLLRNEVAKALGSHCSTLSLWVERGLPYDLYNFRDKKGYQSRFNLEEVKNWHRENVQETGSHYASYNEKRLEKLEVENVTNSGDSQILWKSPILGKIIQEFYNREITKTDISNFLELPEDTANIYLHFLVNRKYAKYQNESKTIVKINKREPFRNLLANEVTQELGINRATLCSWITKGAPHDQYKRKNQGGYPVRLFNAKELEKWRAKRPTAYKKWRRTNQQKSDPIELQKLAVKLREEGKTLQEICNLLRIGTKRLSRILKNCNATQKGGRISLFETQKEIEKLVKNSQLTLGEIERLHFKRHQLSWIVKKAKELKYSKHKRVTTSQELFDKVSNLSKKYEKENLTESNASDAA